MKYKVYKYSHEANMGADFVEEVSSITEAVRIAIEVADNKKYRVIVLDQDKYIVFAQEVAK